MGVFQGDPWLLWWLRGKESACNAGHLGLIPELGRSPGEGNGYPLQYSGLENPMDRGAWQSTVHGVAKSQTRLGEVLDLLDIYICMCVCVYIYVHIYINNFVSIHLLLDICFVKILFSFPSCIYSEV